ncbi:MAG: DUF3857 domain-containing protein [Balneolaceae bacterium]|nr:DUF3857 domain-containing protein [Balneolaceae bacterium]
MFKTTLFCLFLMVCISCNKSYFTPGITPEQLAYKAINTDKYDVPVHAVVQDYEVTFDVKDKGNAVKKVRRIVTVLDEDGRNEGQLKLYYDKFRKVKSVKAAIYNEKGRQVKVLNEYDQAEYSSTSSYSLYDEHRVKVFNLMHDRYPYTVVYDYTVEYNGLISWPSWYPLNKDEYVQSSSFTIQMPPDMKVRYNVQNMPIEPDISRRGEKKIYRWSIENIEPIEVEYYGPNIVEQIPMLQTAPDSFSVEGVVGSMKSWKNLGQWYYDLTIGRDELPEDAKQEIDILLEGIDAKKDKVKAVYEHLQNETRYVSVQLGIGGWQPFSADYVYSNKYGDCKALTNYLQSMLAYADIKSYPVLIRSGANEPKVDPGFSSNQFNHVILMVPMEKDTLWLEATSKVYPFNYIGLGNASKNALVVTPSGGKLIRTPGFTKNQNITEHNITVDFDANGTAQLNVKMNVNGASTGLIINSLAYKSSKKRLKWLRNRIDLPSFEITSSDFNEIDHKKDDLNFEYNLTSDHYGTKTGSRFFIPLNKLNKWNLRLPQNKDRKQPVDLKFPFTEVDHYMINLPKGLDIEAIPRSNSYEIEYGTISYEVRKVDKSKIQVKRVLKINQPKVPAEDYGKMVKLFDKIVAMDKQTIILKQN